MLDEEKKAVETLKDLASTIYYGDMNFIESDDLKIILNLIEKQQKEIDDLKQLMAHKNSYTKQLEEDLFENASNYVVNKDKIRDLINKDAFEVNTKEYGNIEVIDINNIHELLKEE